MVLRSLAARSVTASLRGMGRDGVKIASPYSCGHLLSLLPPRPVDDLGAIERPPDDDRLKRQPRPVIKPAAGDVGQIDAVDRVLEIGRPDADRIGRQSSTCPPPQRHGQQRDRARKFKQPGEEDDLRRERHPCRRDREQLVRRPQMGNSRRRKQGGQNPAHHGAVRRGTVIHRGRRRYLLSSTSVSGRSPPAAVSVCHLPSEVSYSMASVLPGTRCSAATRLAAASASAWLAKVSENAPSAL